MRIFRSLYGNMYPQEAFDPHTDNRWAIVMKLHTGFIPQIRINGYYSPGNAGYRTSLEAEYDLGRVTSSGLYLSPVFLKQLKNCFSVKSSSYPTYIGPLGVEPDQDIRYSLRVGTAEVEYRSIDRLKIEALRIRSINDLLLQLQGAIRL